ncbi:uracil-DNA glycosylase family protein [Glaciecola siphonariae]|uniref:Uracil-DNA glycosylase family protein n=1 Tax=Glaciecola siphonariae TaxID=521012 RepID=A0ABV9LZH4_9ALTE
MATDTEQHEKLVRNARACDECRDVLPHAPRPIFIWPHRPKIILISQAPGRLAHDSHKAWNDASGDRLRVWLGVNREIFYTLGLFAVLPMSFCFPGYKNGADAPPLKACAPKWHQSFLRQTTPELIVTIGRYAQHAYLPQYKNLTTAVNDYQTLLPTHICLPHPSGRNNRWLAKHNWFEQDLVPCLQQRVADLVC